MKIEFFETDAGSSFQMKPETVEEVGALARMANSSKSEMPQIVFRFGDTPCCDIWIRKVAIQKQNNFISKKPEQ